MNACIRPAPAADPAHTAQTLDTAATEDVAGDAGSADGANVVLTRAARPVLEVRDLCVSFERQGRHAVAVGGISYRLFPGKTLAIIGESGSGKTVSCLALAGLLPRAAAVSGSVRFEGKELLGLAPEEMRRHRGVSVAMVFQDADRALNPTMRVGHQITEAIRAHERIGARAARDRASELLRILGLPEPQRRFFAYPHDLSGGMRQRVMIAIAIAANPKVLIADETSRSLDPLTRARTMELLVDLQRQLGMALILVSHDLDLTARFADDVLVLYAGSPFEQAPAERLFADPRTPYARALLDAIPRLDGSSHAVFRAVPGQKPEPADGSRGCSFAPRCPRAVARCTEHAPAFLEHERDHSWACWNPWGRTETP